MYDDILRIWNPSAAKNIGFTDDIVTIAKHITQLEKTSNRTIEQVQTWLYSVGLELPSHETEAVLISSRRKVKLWRWCLETVS